METIQIEQIQEMALTWPQRASALVITDQTNYTAAAKLLLEIAEIEKRIKTHHEPIKTAAFNAHKVAVATEKRFLDPLNEAKTIIKRAISIWEQEQAKIRADAEKKAVEEALKKEEDERIARVLEAEKAGKSAEEVEKIIETPAPVKIEAVKPTFERVSGVTTRENWHAELTDIKALCGAVAKGEVPSDFVMANMPALNSMARTAKETMSVPGVKAVKEINVVAR